MAILARLARLFSRPSTAPVWVEAAELRRWLAGEGAPVIVDVRGPDEFAGSLGHIAGARNIPLGELPAHANALAAEEPAACHGLPDGQALRASRRRARCGRDAPCRGVAWRHDGVARDDRLTSRCCSGRNRPKLV